MGGIQDYIAQFEKMTPEQAAAHDAEIERLEAIQAAQEKLDFYRRISGTPERYHAESLDTYKTESDAQKKGKAAAETFLRAIKCGEFKTLVLIGNAGTGKTHLAAGILREFGGFYRTAPDVVEELRRAKSFTADSTEERIVKHYGHVPLLVLDEIGRGINAADEKYMIYQVLNARYNTRRPTVLISNFNKADFLAYIGVAAADRLVESAEVVEMNGTSYRQTLRGQK